MKGKLGKFRPPSLGAVLQTDWQGLLRGKTAEMGEALLGGVGGAFDAARGTFDTGFGLLRATIGGIPFLGTTATSDAYDHTRVDEKHYFLIEDEREAHGFALLVLRCLPAGVPPINDLPKRRLLHLPRADALPMLEHIVREEARQRAQDQGASGNAVSANLDALINEIDRVDSKVFGGLLAVGGLVALANPLAGAAIAAKALVPSIGLIAAKYGLKAASRTATNVELSREIRRAEKEVVRQFRSSETLSLVNPVLHHMGARTPLDMWMVEAERFQFEVDGAQFGRADIQRLTALTMQALEDAGVAEDALAYAEEVAEIVGSDGSG